MSVIGLVAGREVRERLRAKSFYVLTALLVVGVLVVGVIGRFAAADDGDALEVGLVAAEADAGRLAEAIRTTATESGLEAEVTPLADADAARRAVEEGDLGAAVVAPAAEVLFGAGVDDVAFAVLQQAWAATRAEAALADAGLSPAQVDEVLRPEPLRATLLDEGDEGPSGVAVLTGIATAVLLFMSLQTFGGYVLMGVVEEKSTAVVELLLVRIRPDQLLAGKVLGIGAVAMVQFAAALLAGLVALLVSGVDVPVEVFGALPAAFLWFVGGYLFYSTLFALAGSLVSRQEDAQAATAPITTMLLAAYLIVFVFGWEPASTPSRLLSLVPPFAPFSMPLRMASGAASVLEIVVAFALLVLSLVGVWWLAGRIYAQVLLRKGTRISWGEALRSLRSAPTA